MSGAAPALLELGGVRLPLAEFTLEIAARLDAPVTALFGRSGAGKTALLEVIAGLRRPQSALILLAGRVLTDTARGVALPARVRRIGYVPQDGALFPHLSARRNLRYGLKAGGAGAADFERVVEVLELAPLLGRDPSRLSGGERQRVALGRALLSAPELLLLDEPLAGLDLQLKERIIAFLRRARAEFGTPMLLVTHDPAEVEALCDEVLVIERGRVVARCAPREVAAYARSLRISGS